MSALGPATRIPDVVDTREVSGKLGRLNHKLEIVKEGARNRDDLRVELSAIREQASLAELQAKLAGDLPQALVNATVLPEWPAVLDALNG